MTSKNTKLVFNISMKSEPILSQRCDSPEPFRAFTKMIGSETIQSRKYDCPHSSTCFKNSIENKSIRINIYDGPRSITTALFKNSNANEHVQSPRYDFPETMLSFKDSIENDPILRRRYVFAKSVLLCKHFTKKKFILRRRYDSSNSFHFGMSSLEKQIRSQMYDYLMFQISPVVWEVGWKWINARRKYDCPKTSRLPEYLIDQSTCLKNSLQDNQIRCRMYYHPSSRIKCFRSRYLLELNNGRAGGMPL